MTKEFAETVNRLAAAKNFEDRAFLLITARDGNSEFQLESKNINAGLLSGVVLIIQDFLEQLEDTASMEFKEEIMRVITEYENSVFKEKKL